MKLILKQQVAGLGDAGDIIEVKDGFGRNYLIPQGFALLATRGVEKDAAAIRKGREVRAVNDLVAAQEIAKQLGSMSVKLTAKSGDGGRLFGSVQTDDIAAAVSRAGGPKLDKRLITLKSPIKTLGSHTVTVKIHPEVDATVTVEVVKL
ncbi:MAG: large subunit ribosomal protein [Frankiaceae bacterium]|jgi:large subunit ribosomal protein L9|nr:large subunit ribosomal protein [Frankiaceae bacterium]MDQ1723372.1 large subunit ribosomal protein [Frankiaceae bacterium]